EAQLNIINTLPCDVDVVNPFNKLQNISSAENYVFRGVSAKNYTSNEIFVFTPKNCDNLKLRVPGARLNVFTSELQDTVASKFSVEQKHSGKYTRRSIVKPHFQCSQQETKFFRLLGA
ncbi:unnamed protein product, partial [Timema podura]|nr:unnamed protein product [Timema podura]